MSEPQSIECPVRVGAGGRPEAAFIEEGPSIVSYRDADARIDGIVASLVNAGVRPGDRIALYGAPSTACVLTLFALWRYGTVACPLHVRRTQSWLAEYVRMLGVRAVITNDAPPDFSVPVLSMDALPPGSAPGSSTPSGIELDAPATIVVTSGSTGNPRAAILTYGNQYFSALGSNENIALGPGDAWALELPLYHVGGLGVLMRCAIAGATIVLGAIDSDRGPGTTRITHRSLVPTQIYRLLREPVGRATLAQCQAVLLGGAPAPDSLIDEAVAAGVPLFVSYGLTELASQVTTTPPGSDASVLRTSGRVLPYRELSVSESGEILVRGRTLFAGYVEGGGQTLPLDAAGWFHTGDRGFLDDAGLLHVVGRIDNLFISGGENVQPEEIERALLGQPNVQEAIVVPV
ncbi:MAG TPA: AMP-binding protein, partial [Rhodothermales bacterium]